MIEVGGIGLKIRYPKCSVLRYIELATPAISRMPSRSSNSAREFLDSGKRAMIHLLLFDNARSHG